MFIKLKKVNKIFRKSLIQCNTDIGALKGACFNLEPNHRVFEKGKLTLEAYLNEKLIIKTNGCSYIDIPFFGKRYVKNYESSFVDQLLYEYRNRYSSVELLYEHKNENDVILINKDSELNNNKNYEGEIYVSERKIATLYSDNEGRCSEVIDEEMSDYIEALAVLMFFWVEDERLSYITA
jgi:hypothetical protein